jgi:hypothetical protein
VPVPSQQSDLGIEVFGKARRRRKFSQPGCRFRNRTGEFLGIGRAPQAWNW